MCVEDFGLRILTVTVNIWMYFIEPRVEDNRLLLLEVENYFDVIFDWEKLLMECGHGGVDDFPTLLYFFITMSNLIDFSFT